MSSVKVLLRADVSGLGRRGDIVEVAAGYARNFLVPKGRGLIATDGAVATATAMRRTRSLKDHKDRESAQALAKQLDGTTIALSARAGEGGRLFGSISATDVQSAVTKQTGAELDRRSAELAEPIKSVGTYEVPFHLLDDVGFNVTVVVSAA